MVVPADPKMGTYIESWTCTSLEFPTERLGMKAMAGVSELCPWRFKIPNKMQISLKQV